MTPLEAMIDAACKCVKCGRAGKTGTCGCWIKIECPKCSKGRWIDRMDEDPKAAVRMVLRCPDCNGGDFDTPAYFDASGCEIPFEDAA